MLSDLLLGILSLFISLLFLNSSYKRPQQESKGFKSIKWGKIILIIIIISSIIVILGNLRYI